MPPPDVKVDPGALRSDAGKWSAAADDMQAAAGVATGLTLGEDKFGASDAAEGCQAAYAALQGKLTTLLNGADAELEYVATALRASADRYENDDRANARRVEKVRN